jgi:hypothetical protein
MNRHAHAPLLLAEACRTERPIARPRHQTRSHRILAHAGQLLQHLLAALATPKAKLSVHPAMMAALTSNVSQFQHFVG